MGTFLSILIIIVCIFLSLIVLVQNSKGGGLAANFSSSNQIMGVRKTADFLEKATWTLAGALVLLCMLTAFSISSRESSKADESLLDSQIENAVDPATIPSFPTTVPTTSPAGEETPEPED
jgi:preprotein translocase subunit SecG